ncbi:MAG: helix-turn-helix transcriptional regulator [Actinomycetota bacterium]
MESWRSAGDVLRWWRTSVLGWTQQQAADRLNVRHSALSNWERGERAISLDLDEVDDALDGGRLLRDLLWSHGTTKGLEPGRIWSGIFDGPSRPVWMWIRSASPRLVVESEWGVARLEVVFDLGPNGVFLTNGATVPDSPIVVQLSSPGWVDFGNGSLPPAVPGAQILDALDLLRASSAQGPLMDMFTSTLEARVASQDPGATDFAHRAPDAVDSYLHRGDAARRWRPLPEGLDVMERQRYGELRRARGLSLAAVAARLEEQTGLVVGRDTLRRFETAVGQPHDAELPVALDHVLGAGGRLAVVEHRSGRGDGSIRFPSFWRGPFWIAFEGPDPVWPTSVVLQRGNFQRDLELARPELVSAHWFDPDVPLRIRANPDLRWRVGVGRRAGAEAIDQNWAPINIDVAQQAISEIEGAMYDAARKSTGDEAPDDRIDEADADESGADDSDRAGHQRLDRGDDPAA